MDEIIVEGVRCFHSYQSIPIKPITVLVGENSSGKSTFLALTRLAWDVLAGETQIDFNQDPFLFGAFDQIASYRQGRTGRVKSFSIGARYTVDFRGPNRTPFFSPTDFERATILGRFINKDAQPVLDEWSFETKSFHIEIKSIVDAKQSRIVVKTRSGSVSLNDRNLLESNMSIRNILSILGFYLTDSRTSSDRNIEGTLSESDIKAIERLNYNVFFSLSSRPYAFAPIRTHPQRTYDPVKDTPRPEGSHVPMILAKLSASDPSEWERMRKILDDFGKASGLFDDVEVRRMGSKDSDPFQIRVKISGPAFNLVDVGYGVSQALPIIVDSLREEVGSTFLLQQPEVHLHPKAQAQLGSFLALIAKQQKKRFLIETHSDYLVDRIRMDIRDHNYLTADDVSILYFERQNGGVKIHALELDEFGNIVNPPSGYRQFFLDEEARLLVG